MNALILRGGRAVELITPEKLAIELHLTQRTLARWRAAGYGPAARRVGSRWLYAREDVNAYLDAQA